MNKLLNDYLLEIEERERYADLHDEYYHHLDDEEFLDRCQRAADIAKEFKS